MGDQRNSEQDPGRPFCDVAREAQREPTKVGRPSDSLLISPLLGGPKVEDFDLHRDADTGRHIEL